MTIAVYPSFAREPSCYHAAMQARYLSTIHQIPAAAWNRLCPGGYPFVRHEFLAALEDSGSVGGDSGWHPHHLLLLDGAQPVAAMPLYRKDHSYGEYVFDWAWADASHRAGLAYYPKLLCAVPFTPCTGPRLLDGGADSPALLQVTTDSVRQRVEELGASGWHCLFPAPALSDALQAQGYCQRLSCQFHWFNRGYRDFQDFLDTMNSRKRKNLRKERDKVAQQGFDFAVLEGSAITESHWDFFYRLYQLTYLKRSLSTGYLNRTFFHQIGQQMPHNLVMLVAERNGEAVAAALFFRDSQTLYGRYWGCLAEHEFLHFETCYYRGIDYAIARGLQRFDGGAQGEHKLQRGFEPVITRSNHWLREPRLHQAVERFVQAEARDVLAYRDLARQHLPFRQT